MSEEFRTHLKKLKVDDLKGIIRGINKKTRIVYSKMKKAELIEAILQHADLVDKKIFTKAHRISKILRTKSEKKKKSPKKAPPAPDIPTELFSNIGKFLRPEDLANLSRASKGVNREVQPELKKLKMKKVADRIKQVIENPVEEINYKAFHYYFETEDKKPYIVAIDKIIKMLEKRPKFIKRDDNFAEYDLTLKLNKKDFDNEKFGIYQDIVNVIREVSALIPILYVNDNKIPEITFFTDDKKPDIEYLIHIAKMVKEGLEKYTPEQH